MATYEQDSLLTERQLSADMFDPPLSLGERLIRAFLLAGFVVVLAVEAWLLWQAWQFWS